MSVGLVVGEDGGLGDAGNPGIFEILGNPFVGVITSLLFIARPALDDFELDICGASN